MILDKKFLTFNIINILDKFLIFFIPLFPLLFLQDKSLYNQIEYVYSISLIIYIFCDGGVKNFSLVFYRTSENKKNFLDKNYKFVNTISVYYFCFTIISILFLTLISEYRALYLFILFRVLLLININYHKIHFSLKNKQKYMLYLSLLVSIFTIGYLTLRFYFFETVNIFDYFLFNIIILFLFFIYNVSKKNILNFKKIIEIFKKSFSFSYPLILNALIFVFIMHFIKIYSYNYLSYNEMTQVSFITRVMLIILVLHSGFLNFYYKKFFKTHLKKFDYNIFFNYCLILILSSVLIFFIFPSISSILNLNLKIDLIFVLIFSYTFIWCISAFLEQYLNKFYQNIYILYFSIISLFFYILVIIYFEQIAMLERICLAMIISVSIYFVLILSKVIFTLNGK